MSGLGFVVLEIALVALVLVLLNARDRRRQRALALVLDACPPTLRSSIALNARARLLSPRVTVVLDVADSERADVLAALTPLAGALPPHVALVIGARLDLAPSAVAGARTRRRSPAPHGLS